VKKSDERVCPGADKRREWVSKMGTKKADRNLSREREHKRSTTRQEKKINTSPRAEKGLQYPHRGTGVTHRRKRERIRENKRYVNTGKRCTLLAYGRNEPTMRL